MAVDKKTGADAREEAERLMEELAAMPGAKTLSMELSYEDARNLCRVKEWELRSKDKSLELTGRG